MPANVPTNIPYKKDKLLCYFVNIFYFKNSYAANWAE
jgi:hypothetical protein